MTTTLTDLAVARAHATGPATDALHTLTTTLDRQLGTHTPAAILYFASTTYDPHDLAGPLTAHYPTATVIGCSTAGEFTDTHTGTGGITAIALPHGILTHATAALADLSTDAATGTDTAITTLQTHLGPLRDLDPTHHLGIVLIDGMHGVEELVNERIGNAAPALDIVGGSAGDDLAFTATWVAAGTQISWNGMVLLIAETAVPFHIIKTCSFTPTGTTLRITKADVPNRTVLEFDGQPAQTAYAHALGLTLDQLDTTIFMTHPVGLIIDDHPWIRSPQTLTPNGGIRFYAQILEGMDVELMISGDLTADTSAAIIHARTQLGGHTSGAILFNCILRRLEIDAKQLEQPFLDAFTDLPLAGFHTYGETWLGHVNQTLTGVIFG